MIKLSTQKMSTLLAIHGWSAVALGLFLYVVIVTGTLVVFDRELGQWASPTSTALNSPLPAGTGKVITDFAGGLNPDYLDEVFVFPAAGDHLRMFFHHHTDSGEEVGVLALLDPAQGTVIARYEGEAAEVFRQLERGMLVEFLVRLHVRLLMPGSWGLIITGTLGFALLVASISGLFIHRHLIRELFTLRHRKGALLTARDAHALAGSWNLIFALILSFTGAFFSVGSALGLPAIAYVAFGGDVETLSEQLLSPPIAENARHQPLADLEHMLADAGLRSGVAPVGFAINHWGRADAALEVLVAPRDGELWGDKLLYAAGSGEFLGVQPPLGKAPSLGGDLVALMSPLHFGDFAGLWSKILWFALGASSAYVCASGLKLWLKRREDAPRWRLLARLNIAVTQGVVLAMIADALIYFLALGRGLPMYELLLCTFILVLLASTVAALCFAGSRVAQGLRCLSAAGLVALPLVRMATGGPDWLEALAGGHTVVVCVDAIFALAGCAWLWQQRRSHLRATVPMMVGVK